MTEDKLPLAELLAKSGDADFLRSVAEAVLQMLMEADVEGLIGAGRHERTGERLNWRNGFRDRSFDTRRRRRAHRQMFIRGLRVVRERRRLTASRPARNSSERTLGLYGRQRRRDASSANTLVEIIFDL